MPLSSAPTSSGAPIRFIDKAAVVVCVATLAVLYVFLFRVVEGSWMTMLRDGGHMLVPIVVYLGLVVSITLAVERRGGNAKRWWLLVLLPACGAFAGLVGHMIDPTHSILRPAMTTGAGYGVMHALYLWWAWRREARRTRPAAV